MRKYLAIAVAMTFLLFALGLMAQTTGSSGSLSNQQSGSSSSQNPDNPTGSSSQSGSVSSPQSSTSDQSQSSQTGSQTGTIGSSTGSSASGSMGTSSEAGKTRSVEGCVVREQTDFYLIPRSGNPIHLTASASENLDQYVGQRVKAHGAESSWGGAMTGSASPGAAGTTGAATGSAQGSMGSTQTGTTGAVGAETGTRPQTGSSVGQTGAMGTSGEDRIRQAADKHLTVDRVTKVESSCPSDWNPSFSTTGSASQSQQQR
ncbi:MAG: hypothetical protein ACE14L_02310 [Terriglobales bacterium]